jgi:hypothetical protein
MKICTRIDLWKDTTWEKFMFHQKLGSPTTRIVIGSVLIIVVLSTQLVFASACTPIATSTATATVVQLPSATITASSGSLPLNLNNETGNFSQYTAYDTDGGDLTVSPQAGLGGTGYGLNVRVSDNNLAYAYKTLGTTSTTGVIRARFYIDPNGLSMGDLSQVSFIYFISSRATDHFASMKLMKISGGYYLRGVMIDDNGVHRETDAWPITDEPHYAEIRVTRATSASSANATYETWIDGVAKKTMTGVDSYDTFLDFKTVSVGRNSIAGTISGSYSVDEIAINDDGSEIGPIDRVGPPPTPKPGTTPQGTDPPS